MDGLDPEFLQILVCPETHQPLSLAAPEVVARMVELQKGGQLKNRGDALPSEPIEAALVRQDGKIAYAISDAIPNLLIDEGIPLDQL